MLNLAIKVPQGFWSFGGRSLKKVVKTLGMAWYISMKNLELRYRVGFVVVGVLYSLNRGNYLNCRTASAM